MRNSKKRLEILNDLREGGYLESNICGWFERPARGGKKIRIETQEWLEATGELVEITKTGKYLKTRRIYHVKKIPTII